MPGETFSGKAVVFGDSVDTDSILSGKHLAITDEKILAGCLFEGYPDEARKQLTKDHIIIAGKNFGCGSSREGAPLAIRGRGITVVIAESFARIFYRNAVNIGLLPVECPGLRSRTKSGDLLSLNLKTGMARNLSAGMDFKITEIPAHIRKIIGAGGLVPLVRAEIMGGKRRR
jgi:3-isopropylmalate/(R)-2-methylmalate dehydratase small subunit